MSRLVNKGNKKILKKVVKIYYQNTRVYYIPLHHNGQFFLYRNDKVDGIRTCVERDINALYIIFIR
jgi:hypothetical protein